MHDTASAKALAMGLDFRARPDATFFVLSGPGGTGKTTLIKRWLADCSDLGYVANVTTRKPRPAAAVNESGFYEFVSRADFQRRVRANEFAQWVNPSAGKYYGTPIAPLQMEIDDGRDLVFDYTPQLYVNLRRQFKRQVVGIFIVPPTFAELMRRLQQRGTESGEELLIKQQMAVQDINYVDEHQYHVINDDVDAALATLKSIRTAERCLMSRVQGLQDRCKQASPRTMLFYYDPLGDRVSSMAAECP